MKKLITGCLIALCSSTISMATNKTVYLRVIQTSDVHGSFFPYDFINRQPKAGSLARVITYVDSLRAQYGKNLILLDNGDILQGQPTCYYYNYVKPNATNIAAQVVNYMQYDAQTIGNHDIETGHTVYDKWISQVKCPVLGANIVNTNTAEPYVKPYTILHRNGIKIAIIGMLTPAIPNWLSEKLWSGLRFENMVKTAQHWMNIIQTTQHPDVVIGLFHSGKQGGITTPSYQEDASLSVAKEVPGFDLILFGHDHTLHSSTVRNIKGKQVVCLNPSCNALNVADAEIKLTISEHNTNGKKKYTVLQKQVNGRIVDITTQQINKPFIAHFQTNIDSVKAFVNRKIGTCKHTIYSRDCFFGSSALTDFIHNVQLKVTGADVSFNAPLDFDTQIKEGNIYVSDLFNLYKYENQIYVVKMTGEEIKKHLEMSYNLWVNTMTSPNDHIIQIDNNTKADQQRYGFKNLTFNFDSAAGIDYEVDVTKPFGKKVKILRMSNGTPFYLNKTYKVAMNSYRGNGGGELLTRGAGINPNELKQRIVFRSEHDQRYYLMKWIKKSKEINAKPNNNWKFVPGAWTVPALKKDRMLIFGNTLK